MKSLPNRHLLIDILWLCLSLHRQQTIACVYACKGIAQTRPITFFICHPFAMFFGQLGLILTNQMTLFDDLTAYNYLICRELYNSGKSCRIVAKNHISLSKPPQ